MQSLSDIKLGQIGQGLVRFRPFLGALGAVLLVLVVLPMHRRGHTTRASLGPSPADVSFAEAPSEPAQASAPTAESAAAPTLVVDTAPAFGVPAYASATAEGNAAFAAGPGRSDSSTASTASDYAVRMDSSEPVPLTVVSKAWASREAGTPLATTGVPDGALPVGNRLGQLDKASYVRLAGTAPTLVLKENPDGSRSVTGTGGVQACRITGSGWSEGQAMAFDQAPAYDPNACAAGKRDDSGAWAFDLSAYADRGGSRGFALVPTADAPPDFQVAFGA